MLDGLKARFERFLADHTSPDDPRARAAQLHAAVLDARVAVGEMRSALQTSELTLTLERQQLADAQRRGALAAAVPDPETVQVAEQFAARHLERIAVLEKKVAVQRDELLLAERDVAQWTQELKQNRQGTEPGPTPAQAAAWRDLEAAGAPRSETDVEGELLKGRLERALMDAAVLALLDHLKKKLGKE